MRACWWQARISVRLWCMRRGVLVQAVDHLGTGRTGAGAAHLVCMAKRENVRLLRPHHYPQPYHPPYTFASDVPRRGLFLPRGSSLWTRELAAARFAGFTCARSRGRGAERGCAVYRVRVYHLRRQRRRRRGARGFNVPVLVTCATPLSASCYSKTRHSCSSVSYAVTTHYAV
jgi:hypothetical protein